MPEEEVKGLEGMMMKKEVEIAKGEENRNWTFRDGRAEGNQ